MLDPNPSEQQIEEIREIVDVSSTAEVAARVALLSQYAWTATISDIAAWIAVRDKTEVIKGGGVEIDDSKTRIEIRNRVRVRLGYPKVGADGSVLPVWDEDFGTTSVDVQGAW